MRTFAQNPKSGALSPSARSQDEQRRAQEHAPEARGESAASESVAHDFSRIPLFPGAGNFEAEADHIAMKVFGNRSFPQEKARVLVAPERGASIDEPVPAPVREPAESLLGRDFSSVRLREASALEQSAAPAGTLAFTRGNTISFFPGSYQPHLPLGQALIAHELTHVAQQRAAPALPGRGQDLRASFVREIDHFRADHPSDRLASAYGSLADPSALQPLSNAPSGMQQRSACSSGCESDSPAPVTAPAPAAPAAPAGDVPRAKAKALIEEQDAAKAARDQLDSALAEIRKGTALEFHTTKTPAVIKRGAAALGIPEAGLLAEWDWFLKNGPPTAKPRADNASWKSHRDAFRAHLQSSLDKLQESHPKSHGANYLKNTPASIFTVIIEVATPAIPPAFLYALAGVEGLVDQYVRRQVPSPANPDRLSDAELATVSVNEPVSGFGAVGIDDFFTDLEYKRKPLRGFFPPGFDETKMTESRHLNEEVPPREVRSADAPDLKTALQAVVAMVARRQAMFQEDAAALGYAAPTTDELVYFTYVYYNAGPGDPSRGDGRPGEDGGYQTLSRHRPKHPSASARRALGAWISLKEYPYAIKLLQTYQFIVASGVLKGY